MFLFNEHQLAYGLKGLHLNADATLILRKRYVEGASPSETARSFDVSRQYVNELERKFKTNLKKNIKADGLEITIAIVKTEAVQSIRDIEGID